MALRSRGGTRARAGRFLLIFFTTGLFASAASYAFAGEPTQVSVGASGAIFGVVGAFVAYNYRHRELALAAARLRGLVPFLILNLLLGFGLNSFIDWRAHLGGFVAGLAAGIIAEGWVRARRGPRSPLPASAPSRSAPSRWRPGETAQYRADFPAFF